MVLDPRTKLLILSITSISVFLNESIVIECLFIIIPVWLLLQAKKFRMAIKQGIFFMVLLILQLFVVSKLPVTIAGILYMFDVYMRKLIPCFMLGSFLIHTTKVSTFLVAFSRLRFSKGFTIALSVTLRYFPTMSEEWNYIKEAMILRGINASLIGFLRHPIRIMEYVYVPMLVSASKISDEITQAAITRGIDHVGKRSCIEKVCFSVWDALIVMIYIGIIGVMLFNFLRGGVFP